MTENHKRLVQAVVAAAAPQDREYVVWDTALPGFGLRVRPTGAKSFIYVYRLPGGRAGKVRRVTIKADTPERARTAAKALAGQFHGGADPAGAKAGGRVKSLTVGAVLDRFLTDHVDTELKPSTAFGYRRVVERILKPRLGALGIDAVATKDVAEAYQAMRAKPTQAALAVRIFSSAMSLAEEWGLRPAGSNPARIRLRASRRRERLFTDSEVARLMASIGDLLREEKISRSVALALRLLFATGCRAGEIINLEWANVDVDAGVMRWPDSKTGFLEKPITTEVRPLLKSATRVVGVPWVCPSANLNPLRLETLEEGFERVMERAGVEAKENASLHLIRHWFASKTYSDKSIPLPLQMKIVGHTAVATAMRYAHVTREEVHAAAGGAARRRTTAVKAAGKRGRVIKIGAAS